jgi:hypothetical protein
MSGLVYLLGGSSSVGKTTAAATVAQRLSAAHLQVDAIAQASQDPRVRRFQADVDALWSLPADHVCELLIEKGEALAAQINAIIRRCSATAPITVVEGEGIHPSLARQHPAGGLTRFAFVVEPEQAVLFQTLTRRSARFRACPPPTSTPSPPPTGCTATGCGGKPYGSVSPGSSPDRGQPCPTGCCRPGSGPPRISPPPPSPADPPRGSEMSS